MRTISEALNILEAKGVESIDEINKLYRAQVRKWHPDLHQGLEAKVKATSRTIDLNNAIELLRRQYRPKKSANDDSTINRENINSFFNKGRGAPGSKQSSKITMPFGKHEGQYLGDIPASYLMWLYEQDWLKEKFPDVNRYIQVNLGALQKEHEAERRRWRKYRS